MDEIINPFVERAVSQSGVAPSKIPARLLPSYAQRGEDTIVAGLIAAHLYRHQRARDSMFYVEVGANHPITTSNTFLFHQFFGGHGVLVEADPELIAPLERVRPWDVVVHTAVSTSDEPILTLNVAQLTELSSLNRAHVDSFGNFLGMGGVSKTVDVPNTHINALLAKYTKGPIDFLSIDCEGIDLEILQALDFERFRPYIIQCEPSEHFAQGNRDKMILLLDSRSYNLIAMTEVNLIFCRR